MPLNFSSHFNHVQINNPDGSGGVLAAPSIRLLMEGAKIIPPTMDTPSSIVKKRSGLMAVASNNSGIQAEGYIFLCLNPRMYLFLVKESPTRYEEYPNADKEPAGTSEWDNRTEPPEGEPGTAEGVKSNPAELKLPPGWGTTLEGDDALRYRLNELLTDIDLTTAPISHLELLAAVTITDALFLDERDKSYGSSWKKRGGIGAFMMLARKWDRIEQIMGKPHDVPGVDFAAAYDVFAQCEMNVGNVLDDVRDLRRYLTLVEGELLRRGKVQLG